MNDIEILREAARLMRQRANAASDGPWATGTDGLVWARRLGDPVSGSTEPEDAEHIASWHPAVALLIAAWLDNVAARAPWHRRETPELSHATVIARAYLAEVKW